MARERIEERVEIPVYIRQQVLNDCGRICAHCGVKLRMGDNFTLEHVIPLSKGGKNDMSNYVALCGSCNKSKSDDIVNPQEYYRYLPNERLKEVQKMFKEYCNSVDWLGYDNIFKTDQFSLSTTIPVLRLNGFVDVPATYDVKRMRRDEFLEYSMIYRSRLSVEDKSLFPYFEEGVFLPYYKVVYKGEIILVVSPYILKSEDHAFKKYGDVRHVFFLDLLCNPAIEVKRNAILMLYNIIMALLAAVKKTFTVKGSATVICYSLRVPRSDKIGSVLLKEIDLNAIGPHSLSVQNVKGGELFSFDSMMTQGTKKQIINAVLSSDDGNPENLFDNALSTMQGPISARLQGCKELKEGSFKNKHKKKGIKGNKHR